MKYLYQGIVDDNPTEVTIIQHIKNRDRMEIIRTSRINGRKSYSGFFVNSSEVTTNSKIRNTYFRELLKNNKS